VIYVFFIVCLLVVFAGPVGMFYHVCVCHDRDSVHQKNGDVSVHSLKPMDFFAVSRHFKWLQGLVQVQPSSLEAMRDGAERAGWPKDGGKSGQTIWVGLKR